MSFKFKVLGFELMTSCTQVSSCNRQTIATLVFLWVFQVTITYLELEILGPLGRVWSVATNKKSSFSIEATVAFIYKCLLSIYPQKSLNILPTFVKKLSQIWSLNWRKNCKTINVIFCHFPCQLLPSTLFFKNST